MRSLLRLLICAVASTAAAEPLFETTEVFPVTPQNKPNYRIPAILQAPNGDLIIFAERRNDGPGDIGDHDIVMKRSRDLGRTWNAEQMIFDDKSGSAPTSPSASINQTNGCGFSFCATRNSTRISTATIVVRHGRGRSPFISR